MPISDMVQQLRARLPRLPEGAALYELRQAHREFCQRTHALRDDIDMAVVPEQLSYTLASTTYAHSDIVAVRNVWRRSADDIAKQLDGNLIPDSAWFVTGAGGTFKLHLRAALTLGQAAQIRVDAVLIPREAVDDADEGVLLEYREGIIGRAVWSLATRPGRSWTSKDEAVKGDLEWRRAIGSHAASDASGSRDGRYTLRT